MEEEKQTGEESHDALQREKDSFCLLWLAHHLSMGHKAV